MSTDRYTARQRASLFGLASAGLIVLIVTGLLLREYGPGNMGVGFLVGAALALVAAAVGWWRVKQHPERSTTFERAWTQTGDERDDSVLTRALAVLGLVSLPLTGVATIAIGLGATTEMILALLLFAEFAVAAMAFQVINRRS